MLRIARTSNLLDSSKVSFRTHLNYIKCFEKLLSSCELTVPLKGISATRTDDITRFQKLYNVTLKSIKKDVELVQEDSAFAVIAAPWFPVKCYYALYYLESILAHLLTGHGRVCGTSSHTSVRKQIYHLTSNGRILFSVNYINREFTLAEISRLPTIDSGQNACANYWEKPECINSIAKKLMEYKLLAKKRSEKWNLHKKKDREAQKKFIGNESLMILDFFYWYRIKANYRDLDYIDFENGITEQEISEYTTTYYNAFERYSVLLDNNIKSLI